MVVWLLAIAGILNWIACFTYIMLTYERRRDPIKDLLLATIASAIFFAAGLAIVNCKGEGC